MMETMISKEVFGIAMLSLVSLLYIFLSVRHFRMWRRFKKVIDVEGEVNKEKGIFEAVKAKSKTLNNDYERDKRVYDSLKKEIATLEEDTELISFGLYKPVFRLKTSAEYQQELEKIYELQKQMIRSDKAITSRYSVSLQYNASSGGREKGRQFVRGFSKLLLRAFNGEADSAITKVSWNNISTMRERIASSFKAINKAGELLSVAITDEYKDSKIKELELVYEYEEKLHDEKEEQRKIREQMREEEKVQREIEKAKRDAEDDQARYQKALENARKETERAKGEELNELNGRIVELEEKLKEATALKERAISRAQITKSGHVYVISNIGSFGENVFKIGMTRRLEPLDRIDELGDASVPFDFDVHALIYSENAPALENELQVRFESRRVNVVNSRKEFFAVVVDEIEQVLKEKDPEAKFIKLAEAREYRETLKIKQPLVAASNVAEKKTEVFPESLSSERGKES